MTNSHYKSLHTLMRVTLLLIQACFVTRPCSAADIYWNRHNADETADWSNDGNWLGLSEPESFDAAIFHNRTNAVASVTQSTTVNRIHISEEQSAFATIEVQAGRTLTVIETLTMGWRSSRLYGANLNLTGQGSFVADRAFMAEECNIYLFDGIDVSFINGLVDVSSRGGAMRQLWVTGEGTTLTAGRILLGAYGGVEIAVSEGGALLTDTVVLREGQFGSRGAEAKVLGASSTWVNNGDFQVGTFESNSATTMLSIDAGQLSTLNLTIGEVDFSPNDGLVEVENGGTLTATDSIVITPRGTLQITSGSVTTRTLDHSAGTLNHSSGTLTIDEGEYIHDGSTLTISGAAAADLPQMILDDGATTSGVAGACIGATGRGELIVRRGSTFSSTGNAVIGNESTAVGKATVIGAGSLFAGANNLYIGSQGAGTLEIRDGGSVSNLDAHIGELAESIGVVTVGGAGSTWTTDGSLTVGQAGEAHLSVHAGGLVKASAGVVIGAQGRVEGDGTIEGDVTNSGIISPGGQLGALSIDGAFTQAVSGSLEIEISSLSSYDRLSITDGATLSGAINVRLVESFAPQAGDNFEILTAAGGIVGDFSSYLLPELPGALTWDPRVTANGVTLAIASHLGADFNADGMVDGDDLEVWEADFGAPTPSMADADNDGDSDGIDFLQWQRQSGTGVGAVSAAGAVPEPVSALLLLLAGLVVAGVKRAPRLSQVGSQKASRS